MPNIIFCPNCGASIEGKVNNCPFCGAVINKTQDVQSPNTFTYNQNPFTQQSFNVVPPQPLQYENYNQYQKNDGAYNGCAITGMILGILSIIMCCTSLFDIFLAIIGIILSIIGIKSYRFKGCAIAGLICSIAGLLFALAMTISIFID